MPSTTHLAARRGFGDCVRVLLEEGRVDPDIGNDAGKTALQLAQDGRYGDCVEVLSQSSDAGVRISRVENRAR